MVTTATQQQITYKKLANTQASIELLRDLSDEWEWQAEQVTNATNEARVAYRAQFAADVAHVAAKTLQADKAEVYIAANLQEAKVYGIAVYRIFGDNSASIDLVTVAPFYQPSSPSGLEPIRGIGSGLLCAVAGDLVSRGVKRVCLKPLDAEAERFWRNRGFTVERQRQLCVIDAVQELANACQQDDCPDEGDLCHVGDERQVAQYRRPRARARLAKWELDGQEYPEPLDISNLTSPLSDKYALRELDQEYGIPASDITMETPHIGQDIEPLTDFMDRYIPNWHELSLQQRADELQELQKQFKFTLEWDQAHEYKWGDVGVINFNRPQAFNAVRYYPRGTAAWDEPQEYESGVVPSQANLEGNRDIHSMGVNPSLTGHAAVTQEHSELLYDFLNRYVPDWRSMSDLELGNEFQDLQNQFSFQVYSESGNWEGLVNAGHEEHYVEGAETGLLRVRYYPPNTAAFSDSTHSSLSHVKEVAETAKAIKDVVAFAEPANYLVGNLDALAQPIPPRKPIDKQQVIADAASEVQTQTIRDQQGIYGAKEKLLQARKTYYEVAGQEYPEPEQFKLHTSTADMSGDVEGTTEGWHNVVDARNPAHKYNQVEPMSQFMDRYVPNWRNMTPVQRRIELDELAKVMEFDYNFTGEDARQNRADPRYDEGVEIENSREDIFEQVKRGFIPGDNTEIFHTIHYFPEGTAAWLGEAMDSLARPIRREPRTQHITPKEEWLPDPHVPPEEESILERQRQILGQLPHMTKHTPHVKALHDEFEANNRILKEMYGFEDEVNFADEDPDIRALRQLHTSPVRSRGPKGSTDAAIEAFMNIVKRLGNKYNLFADHNATWEYDNMVRAAEEDDWPEWINSSDSLLRKLHQLIAPDISFD